VLNLRAKRLSAQVNHFTQFAIMGNISVGETPDETPSVQPPTTAEFSTFSIWALSITPEDTAIGQTVTVSATIANTGESRGGYEVILRIDGEEVDDKELILDAGAEYRVSFEVTPVSTGSYEVDINGLKGSFTVVEALPEAVPDTTETDEIPEQVTEIPIEPAGPWYLNWWVIGGGGALLLILVSFLIYWGWFRRYQEGLGV